MPRIILPKPLNFHFKTYLNLRIYDLNYGAHMGNDAVLRIVHEARLRYLSSLDMSEQNFFGISLLMSDCAIVYKNQAFYGDKIMVQISVTDLGKYTFDIFYLLSDVSKNIEIARVKTGMACYDSKAKKISKIPDDFVDIFL